MNANSQKILMIAVGIPAFLIAAYFSARVLKKPNPPGSVDWLKTVASEINKSLPVMIDAETQLTAVIGANNQMIYNYRLVNLSVEDKSLPEKILRLRTGMVNQNCTTPETRNEYLNNGIEMKYVYYDKGASFIVDVVINLDDCKTMEGKAVEPPKSI
jgi:hypothetical protein